MNAPIRIEIPTPFSVGSVNSYLMLGAEPTLVDCGMKTDETIATLQAGLAEHGLTVSDIKHVVITHAHVDHMGLVGWMAEHSDATIWVNEYCAEFATNLRERWGYRVEFTKATLAKTGMPEKDARVIGRYFGGMTAMWDGVPAERVRVFQVDDVIRIGELDWQSIYLPGHAAMQTGFYQPEMQWLFSADCLLPLTPVPVIERDPLDPNERSRGLAIHVESSKKLAALDVSMTYPGHGKPIANHRRLIEKQLARIDERKEACYALVAAGVETPFELAAQLYAHAPQAIRFTGLSMCIGYLDLLIDEGRVTRTEVDDIWHFVPTGS